MTAPTPAPGDNVRVVIETTVSDWHQQTSAMGGQVVTVEVLPPPLKVGDVVNHDYTNVPLGAVVADTTSGSKFFHASDVWFIAAPGGSSWKASEMTGVPRKVVYLP